MPHDWESVSVTLPSGLVERLDALVEEGVFRSRVEALRYGAHLVIRDARSNRLQKLADDGASADVTERLERKRNR